MQVRPWVVAIVGLFVGACAQPSQTSDEKPTGQSSASESGGPMSGASKQRFLQNTTFQVGDAPTQKHSCERYGPREQAIYLPEETYRVLQSEEGPQGFSRDQYLQFMHGMAHARKWHARVEAGKDNSDHSGMSYEEIVTGIQRHRMEEAGSAEAFVEKRLGEELAAKQWAWEIVNKVERFEPAPVSASRLSEEEKQFHRKLTRKQIEAITKEFGDPFG